SPQLAARIFLAAWPSFHNKRLIDSLGDHDYPGPPGLRGFFRLEDRRLTRGPGLRWMSATRRKIRTHGAGLACWRFREPAAGPAATGPGYASNDWPTVVGIVNVAGVARRRAGTGPSREQSCETRILAAGKGRIGPRSL